MNYFVKIDKKINAESIFYKLFGYKKTNDGMDIKALLIGTGKICSDRNDLKCQIMKEYQDKVELILHGEYTCSFDELRKCFYLEAIID